MTPLRGWGPRGHKLIGRAPHGHWRTMTFIAALRCDRIDAPYVLDAPINGQTFTAWVEQCLVPTPNPGDVVILDNLGSHKGKAARQAIRAVRARLLFLAIAGRSCSVANSVFFEAVSSTAQQHPDRVGADRLASVRQLGRQRSYRQLRLLGQPREQPPPLRFQDRTPPAAHCLGRRTAGRAVPLRPLHDARHAHPEQAGRLPTRAARPATRSLRSFEKGLAIAAGLQTSPQLESHLDPLANPQSIQSRKDRL